MTPIEEMLQTWRDGVYDPKDEHDPNAHKRDMKLVQWEYKWKRFRPPMWWIFRWAFNIHETTFTNVYPVKIITAGATVDPGETLTFQGSFHRSPAIDEMAEKITARAEGLGLITKEDEE